LLLWQRRGAAGNGVGITIKYLRRTRDGAAGIGLCTTIKYLRDAASIGLGTTIKYLRHTTSAAADNSLGTMIKYLVNQNGGAGNNWENVQLGTNYAGHPPVVKQFLYVVNSEPHTGERLSVRVYVGPELSCCVYTRNA
jgi:hypothetical protein